MGDDVTGGGDDDQVFVMPPDPRARFGALWFSRTKIVEVSGFVDSFGYYDPQKFPRSQDLPRKFPAG